MCFKSVSIAKFSFSQFQTHKIRKIRVVQINIHKFQTRMKNMIYLNQDIIILKLIEIT